MPNTSSSARPTGTTATGSTSSVAVGRRTVSADAANGSTSTSTVTGRKPPAATSGTAVGSVAGRRAAPAVTLAMSCLATLLVLMSYSSSATTLPQIAEGLGAGAIAQTWILNGSALGLAALLLTAGSLADDKGRKRVFVVGAGVLSAASLVCAVAGNPLVLVLARIVQGVASAGLVASSLGMVGYAFPAGPARVRATALWGAMIGGGLLVGPLLSGELAELWSWRAIYWVLTVATGLVAAAAASLLSESRSDSPRPVDVPGVITLGLGLTALLAAVTEGRSSWTQWSVYALFAAAVLLLAAFVVAELRSPAPMLDLALFRRPAFLAAVFGALLTGLTLIGPMSYAPAILHATRGFSPLRGAVVMAIWTGVSVPASMLSGRLRLAGRPQLAVGFALSGAGNLALVGFAAHWSWTMDSVALVLIGLGSGLINAALARLAVESVPADRVSMGSGANNTARYIGGSLGVAGVVAIVGAGRSVAEGADTMLVVAALLSLAGVVLPLILRERRT